ncbi:MAG: peptidase T [Desulfobacteraceae bacterium 4572_87]|nr:MAG: peptidase T [Desulfobacteraceae bacterium 4572_87]
MNEKICSFLRKQARERFLRYVRINTQSDPTSKIRPSSEGQWILARLLKEELIELGLSAVELDAHCYVYASLPASIDFVGPAITFCSHLDTSPSESGANVRPMVIDNYDGGDIRLPGSEKRLLTPVESPELLTFIDETIIISDGRTLLGADDKAGIAEIMAALSAFKAFPELRHPELRIVFTPDEEIGAGTDFIQMKRMGEFGYTMDGGMMGEIEQECFDAWELSLVFNGRNIHPGYAKNRMINAASLAARFVAALPEWESPEHTENREGFYHVTRIEGDENSATVKLIIRDFDRAVNNRRMDYLKQLAHTFELRYGKLEINVKAKDQYNNMNEVLRRYPHVADVAKTAITASGIAVRENPIRGGTDGARLCFLGVPTPNIFTGAMMVHSKTEWIPEVALEKASEVIVRLCGLWVKT